MQETAHAWSKTSPFDARFRRYCHPPMACSLSLATVVPDPTCPNPPGYRRRPAGQDTGPRGAVRRSHGLANLPRLRTARPRCRAVGGPAAGSPAAAFPPCSVLRSCTWLVWNRLPKGCISRTGAASTWPVKPSAMASSRPSVRVRCDRSCTASTCSRTAPDTGRRVASTRSSRSGPSGCCGATEMPRIWLREGSGGRLRR